MMIALHAIKAGGGSNARVQASAQAGILTIIENDDGETGKYHLFFRLYIINTGKMKIMIPTAGFRKGGEGGRDYYTSILRWDFYHTREGSTIIPPVSSLGIAELLPGESALISWEADTYWKPPMEKISVKLEVDADFRSRFNLALTDLMVENIETGFIKDVKVVSEPQKPPQEAPQEANKRG